jgi:flagellar biogenesis protein FliO
MSDYKKRQQECTREDAVIIFGVLGAVIIIVALGLYNFVRLMTEIVACL